MRNREVIINTLATYFATSVVFENITSYRVYPHWREGVPVVNITDDGEELLEEDQILGGYYRRTLELVFEVITRGDTAMSVRNAYDLEIERLIAVNDNPIDLLEDSDGINFKVELNPLLLEPSELSGEGEDITVTTRIHWQCKYFEKAGGTA